ncbi:uncharacterized protein NEMAJ01_0621 [Nematocida major]|uniref:uncharacterized protein n=1 Tax=Nematocida major TaxID=1912982 RepID=UPI002007B7F3|nr:uncharacterized protein NEMAJ01_0621 [Nematocida major]KAH9385725.1 hypothetical protein NEMAJ01_0621 [Nematocida major]
MYVDAQHSAERGESDASKQIFAYTVHVQEKKSPPQRREGISKVTIEGVALQTRPRDIYAISDKFDICELEVCSPEEIFRCVQWKIDMIRPDLTKDRCPFNKGSMSSAVHSQIYVNINMAGYRSPHRRRRWIYNVKEVLRLCSKKHIIVSFGAEIMPEEEVVEIFKKFKVKESVTRSFFTENIERMLIQAATRKYAYMGVLVHMQENETVFKKMVYKATKTVPGIK